MVPSLIKQSPAASLFGIQRQVIDLARILLQIEKLFTPRAEVHHQLVPLFSDSNNSRAEAITGMERIFAPAYALDDCLTFPMLLEWILAASHKPAGNCNSHCIEERRGKVHQAEDAFVDGFMGARCNSARNAYEQRHTDEFFRNLRRRVKTSAVLQKFFSVIGGESQHAFIPYPGTADRIHQGTDLFVGPAKSRVVEPDDLFAMA